MEIKDRKITKDNLLEEVILSSDKDYYLMRWIDVCEYIKVASLRGLIASVVIAVIIAMRDKHLTTIGKIINFFPDTVKFFVILMPVILLFMIVREHPSSSKFFEWAYYGGSAVVSGFVNAIRSAFSGGIAGLIMLIPAFIEACICMIVIVPLGIFLGSYAPLLLLFNAVMYLINRKISISKEAGAILDMIVPAISGIITIILCVIIIKNMKF